MWLLDPCYGYGKFFNASWCCDTTSNLLQSYASIGTVLILVSASGQPGSLGDGGLAQNASISSPGTIAIDMRNNLFIVDGGSRLRAVSPGGLKGERTISTITGLSGPGYADGTLTSAQFRSINAIAFRPTTNAMLLADSDKIRRIDSQSPDGIEWHGFDNGQNSNATTVAGPFTLLSPPLPSSLSTVTAIVEYNSSLIIADQGSGSVFQLPLHEDTSSRLMSPSGPFRVLASIASPTSLAVDPQTGDIFVSDSSQSVIYKLSSNPDQVTTIVAGNTSGQELCQPRGLLFQRTDEGGPALFFANTCNGHVLSLNLTTGNLSTVLRSTPDLPQSGLANLSPTSLAFDFDSNLYVSDALNNRVWMVSRLCLLSGRCQVYLDVTGTAASATKLVSMKSVYVSPPLEPPMPSPPLPGPPIQAPPLPPQPPIPSPRTVPSVPSCPSGSISYSTSPWAICEGYPFIISCPPGSVILNVTSAFFGRSDSTTCSVPKKYEMLNTHCSLSDILLFTAGAEGLRTYTVPNPVFSYGVDPCSGTYKWFSASWCCGQFPLPGATPPPTIRPQPPPPSPPSPRPPALLPPRPSPPPTGGADQTSSSSSSSSSSSPTSAPSPPMPPWAIGIIITSSVCAVALIATTAVLVMRRGRRFDDHDGYSSMFSNPWYSPAPTNEGKGVALGFPIAAKAYESGFD